MDRTLISPMEQTRDYDFQKALHDVMLGLAYTMEDALGGTTAVVSGLAAAPTSPATLTVNIGAGRIYQIADADATTDGSITAVDDTQIMQQGIKALATGQTYAQQFTLTPPATAGQNQWALIEAIFNQADGVRADDPTGGNVDFYNPTNPDSPVVSSINTVRYGECLLSVIYGTAATAGTEVPPNPSAGAVPLYLIDLSNGQTQITSGEILVAGPSVGTGVSSSYPAAPFLAGLLNSHHAGTAGQAPQIKLTSEVQGTLPVGNGGTGGSTSLTAREALGVPFSGIVTVTGNHTVTTADAGTTLDVAATGVNVFFGTVTAGTVVSVRGYNDGTTAVSGTGGAVIYDGPGGAGVSALYVPGFANFTLESDGTDWHIVATSESGIGRLLNVQRFTASGTYTPTAGTIYVIVEGIGGGGPGGLATGGSGASCGPGGSSGAYAVGRFANSTAQTVTIGTGGTTSVAPTATSFGSLLVCPGGYGGSTMPNGTSGLLAFGGVNSTAPTGGNIKSHLGWPGENSYLLNSSTITNGGVSGNGGSSPFGQGASGQALPIATVGTSGNAAAANTGAGGGGGILNDFGANVPLNAFGANVDGGAGGSGVLIVYEYS